MTLPKQIPLSARILASALLLTMALLAFKWCTSMHESLSASVVWQQPTAKLICEKICEEWNGGDR